MVAKQCKNTSCHSIVHLKMAKIIIYVFYHNNEKKSDVSIKQSIDQR